MSEPTVVAEPTKPNLTIAQLKNSYVQFPTLFFEQKLSPLQFGQCAFTFLKAIGLGDGPVRGLGYTFCIDGALSPVAIAVYFYYCFNGAASLKEVAKKRKLTPRIVERTRNELIEVGLLVEDASGTVFSASLEDLDLPPEFGAVETQKEPATVVSTEPETVAAVNNTQDSTIDPVELGTVQNIRLKIIKVMKITITLVPLGQG